MFLKNIVIDIIELTHETRDLDMRYIQITCASWIISHEIGIIKWKNKSKKTTKPLKNILKDDIRKENKTKKKCQHLLIFQTRNLDYYIENAIH